MLVELEHPRIITSQDLVWKNLKRRARVPAMVVLAVAALSLLGLPYLLLDSRAYQYTSRIQILNKEKAKAIRENDELRYQIAQHESLARVEAEAIKLGFVAIDKCALVNVDYHTPSDPVPTLGERIATQGRAISEGVSTGWGAFQAWQHQALSMVYQWLASPNQ